MERHGLGGGVDRDAVVERMEALLHRLLAPDHVRHAVLGVTSLDGAWGWTGAAGEATPRGTAMQSDTPWFLASVTKLHITAVLLRLHERGLVDLDAPISAYLPSELSRGLHVLDGVDHTSRITPTHLLGHHTGLPDWLDERPRGGRSFVEEIVEDGDRAWSFEDAVARARDHLTPHFPPSDTAATRPRIRYSDTNYQLLMVIAQHVTGQTMRQMYQELLFDPLELRDTWLPGDQPERTAREPATTWLDDLALTARPLALRSFGDLYSTVNDMLQFGRRLFKAEVFQERATADVMWRHFNRFGFPRGMASLRSPSWPIEYGRGVMRFELPRLLAAGRRMPALVGHTGSTGSWLWHSPELGLLITGTVDQTNAAAVPFRSVPRSLAGLTS